MTNNKLLDELLSADDEQDKILEQHTQTDEEHAKLLDELLSADDEHNKKLEKAYREIDILYTEINSIKQLLNKKTDKSFTYISNSILLLIILLLIIL